MRRFIGTGMPVAAVRAALGVLVLVDVLRVFLPSLITIFGQAGGTPAQLLGLYAVSWFVVAFGAVAVARMFGADRVAWIAAIGLLAGRAALQFTHGGRPQLYLASVTLLAGLCWLIALAIDTRDARVELAGLVAGLAIATAVHAGLDTVDLVWRTGPVPVVLLAVELAAFAAAEWTVHRRAGEARPDGVPAGAPRVWLCVGPTLLLWGLYTGSTAHAQASSGWSAFAGASIVAVAGMLSIAVVARPRLTGHPVVPAMVLLASAVAFAYGAVTVSGVHGVAPWWTVLAQVAGAVALAGCLGWAALTPAAPHPSRQGLAMAAGLLLFVLLVFAYYAAYDLFLPNDYVPIVAAGIIGLLGVIGVRPTSHPIRFAPLVGPAVGALVAVVLIAMTPLWRTVRAPAPSGDALRVASYNIRMGFGLAGTMTVPQQADALAGLGAQVIALSEVDRAWLLNGGHDDLRLIADRLGMRYLWAPATDEVWGDALLTNLPVVSVRNHVLVRGGPTGAQALEVRLRWNGRDITVIATHLQPPADWSSVAQAEQLADIVRAAPKPVVLAGDLNTQPFDQAWPILLHAGLTDPFATVRPFNTVPSPDNQQIDHILVSDGFEGTDQAHPDVAYSDHRPIAVTLTPS